MGHQAVDPGTDVDMPDRVVLEYPSRNKQVLVKVMTPGLAALQMPVFKAGIKGPKGKNRGPRRLPPDLTVFPQEGGQAPEKDEKGHPFDYNPETHDE